MTPRLPRCLHYRAPVQDPQTTAVATPVPAATLLPERPLTFWQRLRSPSRLRSVVDYAALAVIAFVPMLASQPGVVTDDTKTYLYLDPGRYVRRPRRCGTRTSASERSPTRTSA